MIVKDEIQRRVVYWHGLACPRLLEGESFQHKPCVGRSGAWK
jgi:hypothetical protein